MSNKENRVGRGVVEVAEVGLEAGFDVGRVEEEEEEGGGGRMVESCHRLSCCTGL